MIAIKDRKRKPVLPVLFFYRQKIFPAGEGRFKFWDLPKQALHGVFIAFERAESEHFMGEMAA